MVSPGLANGGTRRLSAKFECRKRENQGTEGADGVGCGEEVSPFPLGEGSRDGASCAPPQKKILILDLE